MNLLLDLLVGTDKFRYLSTSSVEVEQVEVNVRGFSAGSYSGLCLLHLLRNFPHVRTDGELGDIALPPALLQQYTQTPGEGIPAQSMHRLENVPSPISDHPTVQSSDAASEHHGKEQVLALFESKLNTPVLLCTRFCENRVRELRTFFTWRS